MKKVSRRITTAVMAVAASAASLMVGGVASALPSGNYVAFGDSFPANPGQSSPTVIGRHGCPQAANNIGRFVADNTGLELHDYSCNGAVVYMPSPKNLMGQVDDAIAQNSVGPDTQLVTFFVGANDTMQAFWAPTPVQDEMFNQSMTAAINRVKERAPQARIMVVGYPEITSRDNVHFACPINVNGFAPQLPAAPVNAIEMSLQNRQARAAAETGVGFVNMKDVGNVNVAMCGKDGERLVSAILDADTSQYNMTNHPTHRGSQVFGETIANVYKSTF